MATKTITLTGAEVVVTDMGCAHFKHGRGYYLYSRFVSFVYNKSYIIIDLINDREITKYRNIVTAAVNAKDLFLI